MKFSVSRIVLCLLVLLFSYPAQAEVFKIATLSPDGSYWMTQMREAADAIAAETENRVSFKFYPGGVMGNDDAVIRKIRIGQLQGAAVPGGTLARFYRDADIYSLPLKFKTFAEVDFVRERIDKEIATGIQQGGFVTFGLAEGGFAYMMSKAPIRTIDDLKTRKVWIPSNDEASLRAVQAFGITPIPLSLADVLTGLQTGLIDTVATSPIGAIALQWYTQVSYLTELPMMYFYAVLAIDQKRFARLTEADRAVVHAHMTAAFARLNTQNRKDNVDAYQALLSKEIQEIKLDAAEQAPWYERAVEAEATMVKQGVVSEAMSQELNAALQTYFASQPH